MPAEHNPLPRRAFLKLATASAAIAAAPMLLRPRQVSAAPDPIVPVLMEQRPLSATDFATGTLDGVEVSGAALALRAGRTTGQYTSSVLRAGKPFTHVSARWLADGPGITIAVRTSSDGTTWSNWQTLARETHTKTATGEDFGVPVSAGRASAFQVRILFDRGAGGTVLRSATVTLLNARDAPPKPAADVPDAQSPTIGNFYRREAWGADDTLRFDKDRNEIWARMYLPVKKVAVHHTATSNAYDTIDDAKAEVRAIYAYHAVELGWGDIGYNALIDKWGNVYEGRRGRGEGAGREVLSTGIVAGHALLHNHGSLGIALLGTHTAPGENEDPGIPPSDAQVKALIDLIAFECARNNIDPAASSDYLLINDQWNNNLQNIAGHRDCFETICPGGYVYEKLPLIRSAVADALKRRKAPALTPYVGQRATPHSAARAQFDWGSDGSASYRYSLEAWREDRITELVTYLSGFDAGRYPVWKETEQHTANLTQLLTDFAPDANGVPAGHYTLHVIGLDEQGKAGYQADHTILVTSGDLPPSVSIMSPAAGASAPSKQPVRLEASATDAEDGSLGYKVSWSSSKDGALGTGAIVSKLLSPGAHKLTASVTDSNGVAAEASVDITITP